MYRTRCWDKKKLSEANLLSTAVWYGCLLPDSSSSNSGGASYIQSIAGKVEAALTSLNKS